MHDVDVILEQVFWGALFCVFPRDFHNTTSDYNTLMLREFAQLKHATDRCPVIACGSYDGLMTKKIT